jgi:hypothetical protein
VTGSDGHDGPADLGVAAAAELFDRLIAEVTARETPTLRVDDVLARLGADAAGSEGMSQMRAVVARAIDLYADLFRETFALYADTVELALRGGGATLLGAGAAGAPVALTAGPGREAIAPVWVHNSTETALTGVALRVTDLAAHDGATVAGTSATFSPAVIDVPAGASSSATLAVAVPDAAASGAYHGHVLATGLPAASVPVRLIVEEAA